MNKNIMEPTITRVSIEALVVCDLAQITQDGKLNIVGIFERIKTKSLPMRYSRFFMVGMLSGEALSSHTVGFSIISPKGEQVIRQYKMSTKLGYNGKANIINDLTGTIFEDAGVYTMVMTVDNLSTRNYRFEILESTDKLKQAKHSLPN